MRVIPADGAQMATGNTYAIKTETVAPSSVSGYSAAAIESLLHSLDPSAVEQAGTAHNAASTTLHRIAGNLASHMSVLAESWQGQAVQAAAGSFRQLHETAVNLAQASQQTGSVLSWLGGEILPFYKTWKAPSEGIIGDVEQFFGGHPQDKAAQQILQRLNNRLMEANGGLPPSVTKNLPGSTGWGSGNIKAPLMGFGSASGGGAGGLVGGAAGGGSGGAPGFGSGAAGLGAGSLGWPGAGTPKRSAVTHLAAYPPPGGTGANTPGGPGPGVGSGASPGTGGGLGLLSVTGGVPGAGPGGSLPGDPAAGGLGSGADVPGAGPPDGEFISPGAVLGPDGMISGVPGGPAAGAPGMTGTGVGGSGAGTGAGDVAAGAGADQAGQGDLGMPLAGAGAGQREQERYRQAWLPEDAGVWESGVSVAPPVIGG